MVKKILLLFVLCVLIALVSGLWWLEQRQELVAPLPYTIKSSKIDLTPYEAQDILIVGNSSLRPFKRHLPIYLDHLAQPLKVGFWQEDHWPIHRILYQLKNLKTWPKILIFHGVGDEYLEQRFYFDQITTIKNNIQIYQDPTKSSLILTFPFLSRFYFSPMKMLSLGNDLITYHWPTDDSQRQQLFEVDFQIYKLILEELIRLAQENKTEIIFVTSVLNLSIPPQKECTNASNSEIDIIHQKMIQHMKLEDFKSAYEESKNLRGISVGNAKTYYLLGQIYLGLGKLKQATDALRLVTSTDCRPSGFTHLHNNILRQISLKYEIDLVDFDQLLNQEFGHKSIFFDETRLQDLHLENLAKELAKRSRATLGL